MDKKYVAATHRRPDLDACAAVWLWRRFVAPHRYGDAVSVEVVFVRAGENPPDVDAVLDTGGVNDPATGRYDHHGAPTASDRSLSATALVYRHARDLGLAVDHLQPLVALVTEGDHGGAKWSRQVGLHALLAAILAREDDDHVVLAQVEELLDLLNQTLAQRARAQREADSFIVWSSDDGRTVAVHRGSPAVTAALLEREEVELVLWLNSFPDTVTVGIRRRDDRPWAVATILDEVIAAADASGDTAVATEVARWYRHGSGVFAMRGTAKNPDVTPCDLDVFIRIARYADAS